jgi:macrodomain Ter protein organizer (MatP/YcbG family)
MLIEHYSMRSDCWRTLEGSNLTKLPLERIAWIDENLARVVKELGEEIRKQEEAGEVLSEWAKSYVRSECTPEMVAKARAQRRKYFDDMDTRQQQRRNRRLKKSNIDYRGYKYLWDTLTYPHNRSAQNFAPPLHLFTGVSCFQRPSRISQGW